MKRFDLTMKVEASLDTPREILVEDGILDDPYNTIYELDFSEVSEVVKSVSFKGGYNVSFLKINKTKFSIYIENATNAKTEYAEIVVNMAHDKKCQMLVRSKEGQYLDEVINYLLEDDN